MPPNPLHPDRRSVQEIVEELRDEAIDLACDIPGIPLQETIGGEAAQILEEFEAALTQIAAGTDDPVGVAADALSLGKPLLPFQNADDADDSIRRLLKPRRS